MTTTTDVAVRNGHAPAQHDAALALIPGQVMWTRDQHAALVAMGIPAKASSAELGVFLHTCQRLRLDPFLRQIYLIYRKTKVDGQWVDKPTTQIGIDGFRVTRDRICAERGVSVEYEDTIWYDADGRQHEVWLWATPPAACKFVVRVDGRRFPATLNFNEYCQRTRDGDLNSMWSTKPSHQIEKCAEAEGLRKAFPNDLSGVILEDTAPLSDPDAPPVQPQRQRVTVEQIRARQTVTAVAETVTPEDASPAEGGPPPSAAPAPPPQAAGGAPAAGGEPDRPPSLASSGQRSQICTAFRRFGVDDDTEGGWFLVLRVTARIMHFAAIADLSELTTDEAARVLRELKGMTAKEFARLAADENGEMAARDTADGGVPGE